ncbi:MAG: hypothetical protein Q9186_003082 [Xanthomendoza sp. 1 TL-2023]
MKITIAIAAIAAFLPIACAIPASNDAVSTDDTTAAALALANTAPSPITTIDSTLNETAIASIDSSSVDLDESNSYASAARTNTLLHPRKVTRNSGLVIKAYREKNCYGPLALFDNVRYDEFKSAKIQSYWISRRLKRGETLSLFGQVGGNLCGRETSHTPMAMTGGCKSLGGGSVGGASCFRLWRRQGFVY